MGMSKRIARSLSIAAVLVVLASGCGTGATDELDALRTETNEVIAGLETDLAARDTTITDLAAELETAKDDASALGEEVTRLSVSLTEAESARDQAVAEAAAASAREQELLVTYDSEIRAEAQTAWDAEVASACADAGAGSGAIVSYVTHTDQLAVIGTRAELVDAVTVCAQPLRDRSADEKLDADCSPGDPDALTRGTSDFVGDCLVMFVVPFQWDSRTGECNFLGSWDSSNLGTRSYRYDGDGLFQAGPAVCSNDLDGADQDDLLKVWVDVVGTYSYDTAAGGTNAVPQFTIVKAQLVSKA